MSNLVNLTLNHAGFAECLNAMAGDVQAEAERIASTATSMISKGSGFHVEMTNIPQWTDRGFGTSRPVAYVVSNDDETAAEEYKDKILTKAVIG